MRGLLDKFSGLSTSSKALVITGGAVLIVAIGCLIGVIATGGFNGF